MKQIFKQLSIYYFIVVSLYSCGFDNNKAVAYFNQLTAIYSQNDAAVKMYLQNKRAATDSTERKAINDKIKKMLLNSIEATQQLQFSETDFGFRRAILEDYRQALKIVTEGPPQDYKKIASIDEQIKWLESFEKEQKAMTRRIDDNIRARQSRFVKYYKISLDSSQIKAAEGIHQPNN